MGKYVYGQPILQDEYQMLMDPQTWYVSREAKGRYANLLLDDWFKRAFGTEDRKRLLQLLLQEIIPERKILSLRYMPQEHINLFPGKKDVRVDVECTDEEGARFVVEMQVDPQNWFYERALYYASFSLMQQMEKGVDEYVFPPVYFIGLMDFSLHRGSDEVLYRYALREIDTGECMTDRLNFIFLELPNCKNALSPQATLLDNFCYSLHNLQFLPERPFELRQEIFELLFESADIAKFTPEEKIKYDKDMTTDRDRRNQLKKAAEDGIDQGIEIGIDIGIEKGMEKGMEKGIEEGMEKGIEKGRYETMRKNIQSLLKAGMDREKIASVLEISLQELEAFLPA